MKKIKLDIFFQLLALIVATMGFSQSPGGVSTNLNLWLKADAGVTSGTGGVTTWTDQSGKGNNATQATSGNRPDFVTNAVNFDPGLDFSDANNDFLEVPDNATLETATFSIFSVYVPDASTQFDAIIAKHNESYVGNGYGLQYFPDGNTVKMIANPDNSYPNFATRSATVSVTGIAQMVGGIYTGSQLEAFTNDASSTYAYSTPITNNSNVVTIGSDHTNLGSIDNIDGDITEVIFYGGTLTTTERNKVESYLATKYGLTLSHDYLNSSATTVWDVTTNASYSNDITGIARDDGSGLDQRQSQSVNSDGIIAVGLGTIATTNALNGNSFSADNSFMYWGNNNADKSVFNQSYNGGANNGLARIWKISESGTVGSVKLRVLKTDLSGASNILVSSNSSFPGGSTTVIALSDDGTYFHVTLDFSDGEYFTFAGTTVGSVSVSPELWLKANAGTSSTTDGTVISGWNDQSGNSKNASQGTGGIQPVYRNSSANNINYNPLVDFDGGDDYMTGSAGAYSRGYYMVLQHDDNVNYFLSGGGDGQMPFGFDCSTCGSDFGGFGLGGMTGDFNYEILTHVVGGGGVWRSTYSSSVTSYASGSVSLFGIKDNSGASGTDIYRNGTEIDNATSGSLVNILNEPYSLGKARPSNAFGLSMLFDGKIAELITYSTRPSDADHHKIESYLAIKYGITLPTNYVSSANTEIWNVTTNFGYGNNITGIGRDDYFSLNQKQSVSTSGGIVSFGLGSVAVTNIDNSNSFSADFSYMAWGNNGGSVASFSVDYDGVLDNGIARIWKVEEVGAIGNVELKVAKADLVANVTYLFVSTDPTFPVGSTTKITLSDDGTYLTTTRDFADEEYFSFGYEPTPTTSASSTLWLRADVGTSTTTNGGAVSDWNDQSAGSNHASQVTGSAQPIYRSNTTDNINFNPVVDFDGSDHYIIGTAGAYTRGNYVVLENDDLIDRNLVGGGNGQMPFGIECSACFNDWAGLGFGGMTSSLTNEVVSHVVGGSGDWRSGYTSASGSYAAGTISLFAIRDNAAATGTDLYKDGAEIDNASTGSIISITNEAYSLGRSMPGNSFSLTMPFDGKIAEVISLSSRPSDGDHLKIQSYLALKYSIEISPDLYSANGSIVWDKTTNSTYSNDIAGIGREDYFSFNQKQSTSRSSDVILTVGLGSIEVDNATNANTFSADEQYFVWGNNNGNLYSDGETDIGTTLNPEVIAARIDRVWKAEEKGSVSSLHLKFDMSGIPGVGAVDGANDLADVRLLVDADGTFASNATSVSPTTYNNTTDIVEFDHNFVSGTGYYFTIGSVDKSNSPLPVSFISFEGKAQKKHVDLLWATATEINNSHFEVERSSNDKDWVFVTMISGSGNSVTVRSYQTKDMKPLSGINYYRLKQVDLDGQFEYSNIVSVNFDDTSLKVVLYPNPVVNTINLFSDESMEYAEIYLVNPFGQSIPMPLNLVNDNEITMDASGVVSGIYYLRIKNLGKSMVKKVIIAH